MDACGKPQQGWRSWSPSAHRMPGALRCIADGSRAIAATQGTRSVRPVRAQWTARQHFAILSMDGPDATRVSWRWCQRPAGGATALSVEIAADPAAFQDGALRVASPESRWCRWSVRTAAGTGMKCSTSAIRRITPTAAPAPRDIRYRPATLAPNDTLPSNRGGNAARRPRVGS